MFIKLYLLSETVRQLARMQIVTAKIAVRELAELAHNGEGRSQYKYCKIKAKRERDQTYLKT